MPMQPSALEQCDKSLATSVFLHSQRRKCGDLIRFNCALWSILQPLPGQPSNGFYIGVSNTHQRIESPSLCLLVWQAPEIETKRREVTRKLLVRLIVDVMGLTVKPADGPMVPCKTAPAPAARRLIRMLLQTRRFVSEAGVITQHDKRRTISERNDSCESACIVNLFPGRAGAARRSREWLSRFALSFPEDINARI